MYIKMAPTALCRDHFYKILLLMILILIIGEYSMNFFVYERNTLPSAWGNKFLGVLGNLTNSHYRQLMSHFHQLGYSGELSDSNTTHPSALAEYLTESSFTSLSLLDETNNSLTEHVINETQVTSFDLNIVSTTLSVTSAELCPETPPGLIGRRYVHLTKLSFDELEKMHPELKPGGRWWPTNCTSRNRVAIIIPYRDREEHLRIFLLNIHPFLQRQQLDYGIYVVEQAGNGKFNRAMLMNIGYAEAIKLYDYQCFIFHDIDLIPENDKNMYSCPEQPRHMSVAINIFNYKLPYPDLFGGVSALNRTQFEKVNGFSNEFWGWGGEDDDMANRVKYRGYKITRYSPEIARYQMLKHVKDTPSPERFKNLAKGKYRFQKDGLNTLKYRRLQLQYHQTFTWVLVEINSFNSRGWV